MGLGAVGTVSLATARQHAQRWREVKAGGQDPLKSRRESRRRERFASANQMTFRQCAEAYIEDHRAGWKNSKHAQQWGNSLAQYAYPTFGDHPVQAIDTELVVKALKQIWQDKTETATRVRQRIEQILDWATVREYRTGGNPARWRGHLDTQLPHPGKIKNTVNHPALPWQEVGAFMQSLRGQEGMAARALEMTILCATRTSETLNATWDEFDLEKGIWVIPAERMKAGRPHRIPLSRQTVALLDTIPKSSIHVFAGRKENTSLSNTSMLQLLKRMERHTIVPHGFRSTFRVWCAEATDYPREIAEAALAHSNKDKVEAAYLRSDMVDKRAAMMQDWADLATAA